ncbi:MAG: nucleotidyltransferase [Alphaproteobacteria bacterium]|nr:nucleotidyltransferase [Alphaproteobacteria bacterium]
MPVDWIETFKTWSKPPSETEEDKASRAARMINDAVRSTDFLKGRNFSTYPTGSYRNNTNVRSNSDVDVAIVLSDAFFWTIPDGMTAETFGLGKSAPYGLADFRADLHRALVAKYGADVTPGNKTFDIAGNSGRLPADATPFLVHRRYTGRRTLSGTWEYLEGVETRPADGSGKRIINWHQEHYDRGVAKNTATNRRFKRVARILKRTRAHMEESGTPDARRAAAPVPSFLIECLVYNCPDSCFNREDGSYYKDVQAVIQHAWNQTKDDTVSSPLVEVSGMKKLFGSHQGWTRAHAHEFLLRAWQHVGFKA